MVEPRMRHVLVALLVMVLAACNGSGAAAPVTAPTAAAGATDPAADGDDGTVDDVGDPVGEIVEVLNVESFMEGQPALAGDGILRDARLTTDATGLVRFIFTDVDAECVLIRSSAVAVVSNGRRLLRQIRGETACEVDSPDHVVEFRNSGRLVRIRRGILRLTATDGGGGTQVLGGRAQAVNPNGGDAVDMGPGDSTGWDTSGALDPDAEPSTPGGDTDEAVAALEQSSETDSGTDPEAAPGDDQGSPDGGDGAGSVDGADDPDTTTGGGGGTTGSNGAPDSGTDDGGTPDGGAGPDPPLGGAGGGEVDDAPVTGEDPGGGADDPAEDTPAEQDAEAL